MTLNIYEQSKLEFLSGGGEMGALARKYPWHNHSLGSPESWPQALRFSLRLLFSSGHPMFLWWGSDLIQFYNDAYLPSIGPERHPGALGQKGHDCWKEIWPIIYPQIEKVLSGDGYTWHQNQLVPITRNGVRENVYWTYSYSPIYDPQAENGVGGVLVICSETTEQVMAEQNLKIAEKRWRSLFDQAPGFICILGSDDYRFEYANKNYFDMIGSNDIIGKTVIEVAPEVEEQGYIALLDKVFHQGVTHEGVSIPLNIGSKETILVDFVYQPIREENGQISGILVMGFDVTERDRAKAKMLEDEQRKDEFLAMLAHELRNPLAPIANAGEILLTRAKDDENLLKIGTIIKRQVKQLSHLVDDLLDISRITQNRITLNLEPLNLSDIIEQAIESLNESSASKKLSINYTTSKQAVIVKGDMTRLVQCVSNMLHNAIKFTPGGGKIEIQLDSTDKDAVFTISDNGIGIAGDMLNTIFDLFVQAESTLDRSQGGLGIGLNIVKRLLEMHQGSIQAYSAGLGHGTSFTVRLPLFGSSSSNVEKTRPAEGTIAKSIMLVDDNEDAANTLAELLQYKGHHVLTAYSGTQAIESLDEFDPNVVLLDIGLPDLNGYEVAQHIRQSDKPRLLVAITGYGQHSDIEKAKAAGFDHHFTKPLNFAALLDVLQ